jgi:signal transduction histidine kinase
LSTGRSRWRRSLGLRLVALFLALALALALVFLGGMQRALSGSWREVIRPLVVDYVDRLAQDIGTPPDPARAKALAARLPIAIHIDGPVVRFDSHPQRPAWRDAHRDMARDGTDDGDWVLRRTTADQHQITFRLGDVSWPQRPRQIGWITLGLLLLVTAGAYLTVRRLFRPLDDIRAGAQRFGQGDFATPIPLRRKDELGDLAAQVNTMAAELQRRLEAKRELLLAISHELRSPLTRARLNTELLDDGAPRQALLRDLGLMRDLITDLLESERLAAGHSALQAEPTDLNALVRALCAEQFPGAAVELQLDDTVGRVTLDPMRIRLALRNLLDNALRHSAGAPPPRLGTQRDAESVHLTVRDFGPGVAQDHLPHLAEAFYRADAARGRYTGGVGLGLHLCQLVARAHGGRLTLRNASPGLVATITVPIAS